MAAPVLRHHPVSGEVIATTASAVLFKDEDTGIEVWIPRSLCEDGDAIEKGDTEFEVATWFLRKEGLL